MTGVSDVRTPLALVVDDDPVLRTIGAEALMAIGFDILEAETGEEGLALAEQRSPDLILLDVQLPGADGLAICQAMRERPELSEVPILIMTGRTDADTIDRTFAVGATDFIRKPLDWQLIQHRVRFLMRANSAFKDLRSTLSDLEASRRSLETVRELGQIGTWELDLQTSEMLWSDELHRLVGTTPSAGSPPSWEGFISLVHEEDRRDLDKAVADTVATRRGCTLEHRFHNVRGETLFVHQYVETTETLAGECRIRGTIQDLTDQRRAEEQVAYLETFDGLTQLPNRNSLRDRLGRLVRRCKKTDSSIAVLSIDLDRFERVNQALGYATGDELLRAVAERLLELIRVTDLVGRGAEPPDVSRFGGDEFTVVLTGIAPAEIAGQAASRILRALAKPFPIGDQAIPLSASIGISLFPEDAEDPDTLLGHAAAAMSHAKKTGGGCYRFFDSSLNQSAALHLALESELARAIEQDQLTLDYQPQCDAETGELVALEALVRWNHPERGRLLPGDFIPVAEASGLIASLGEWVLRRACAQMAEWDALGLPRVRFGVNVSSLQFRQSQIVEVVEEALAEFSLAPSRLELEITETALLDAGDEVLKTCEGLRDLGVGLALDDFGTGYSSLSHLFQFKIDTLKIDRSFVARIGPGDPACGIISAVIAMARRMGITVTAEGVEEPEQRDFLRDEGCDLLQGYLLCRPADPASILEWIREHS